MTKQKERIAFRVVEIEGNGYHPLVDGKMNGYDCKFIIDTGASRTVIDKSIVELLPVIPIVMGEPYAAGVNGETIAIEQVEVPTLSLGNVLFEKVLMFSSDLSAILNLYRELAGEEIHGLIGCDFLEERKACLDFRKREIRL